MLRHSVNEGFGMHLHRKDSSVERSDPFSEPSDSGNFREKLKGNN